MIFIFPERYRVIIAKTTTRHGCIGVHRKSGTRLSNSPNNSDCVRWAGQVWKPDQLSYHLNVSVTPPEEIFHACGKQWCIHPEHMYGGPEQHDLIRKYFKKFGTVITVTEKERLLKQPQLMQISLDPPKKLRR